MQRLATTLGGEEAKLRPGALIMSGTDSRGRTVGMNRFHLVFDGRPWLPSMGEFQYSRYPQGLWSEELRKIKAGGVDIVPTYVFWNHHEETEGVFDWSGRRDLRRFVELCGREALWVVVRMGPFCHGEARNGGLPDWLYGRAIRTRCNDPEYLRLVERLYGEIGRQLKGLTVREGGPIIGIQCENEFMDSQAPWETTQNPAMVYTPKGEGGSGHLRALKRMAVAAGLDVPLHTCTGWGRSPVDTREFLPMFGGYGYYSWLDDPSTQEPTGFFLFRDMPGRTARAFDPRKVPFACCEIGGGIQVFYRNRPVVPPESVEAMHVVQLGSGSNLMGYYVYHGGSNPVGQRGFLNEHRCPRISYDFQAPLSEFGARRPHYALLRRQFLFLKAYGERLAPMAVSLAPEVAAMGPADRRTVRWAVRSRQGAGFVFLSNFQDHVDLPARRGLVLEVKTGPGESVRFPPAAPGFPLLPGQAAILPFNMDLDGVRLVSATTQPVTRLDVDGVPHHVFLAPEGFPPEYVFDSASFDSATARNGTLAVAGGRTLARVRPGTGCLLSFTRADGRCVRVITLTDLQSRQLWQARVAGGDRLFLSDAGLTFGPRQVGVSQAGNPVMKVGVFPPFRARRAAADGLFGLHTLRVPRKKVRVRLKPIEPGKVAVQVPRHALAGVQEVFLRIDYEGDTASAYLDGRLIHDHFWNGTTWELALRPFAPRILETSLVLVLTPRREGQAPAVAYTDMAAMKVDAAGAMRFRSVRAEVVYAAVLRP